MCNHKSDTRVRNGAPQKGVQVQLANGKKSGKHRKYQMGYKLHIGKVALANRPLHRDQFTYRADISAQTDLSWDSEIDFIIIHQKDQARGIRTSKT